MSIHPLRVFSGSAHPALAHEIASRLGITLGKRTIQHLPDSEIHIMIDEVVRDQDIFIIQSCCAPVNEHLMELLLYLDAFRRASVHSISVVIPYFPYARQDRMARGREAISARVVADLTAIVEQDFRVASMLALAMVLLAAAAAFRSLRQIALVSVPVAVLKSWISYWALLEL